MGKRAAVVFTLLALVILQSPPSEPKQAQNSRRFAQSFGSNSGRLIRVSEREADTRMSEASVHPTENGSLRERGERKPRRSVGTRRLGEN